MSTDTLSTAMKWVFAGVVFNMVWTYVLAQVVLDHGDRLDVLEASAPSYDTCYALYGRRK